MQSRFILSAIIFSGLLTNCALNPQRSIPEVESVSSIYTTEPSQQFRMMGYFATGVISFDMDQDGWNDLLVSNGNDMAPQALTAYKNPGTSPPSFSDWPTWYSRDQSFRGDLSAGDIDHDGWIDAAVSIPFDESRYMNRGGVVLYKNRNGVLEKQPSYKTKDGYMSLGNTLADVDGDGDLDLIAAVFIENAAVFPPVTPITFGAKARIYLNNNGELDSEPSWLSDEKMQAADVVAADINQDGLMDLAFAAEKTRVYYGYRKEDGSPWIRNEAGWTSANSHGFSYSIEAGKVGDSETVSLAVSSGCISTQLCSYSSSNNADSGIPASYFFLYEPTNSTSPTWESTKAVNASKLRLGDVDGDGYLDLATSQWGINYQTGGPLWIFQGSADGLNKRPGYKSKRLSVGQAVQLSNLQRTSITKQYEATIQQESSVLTLPEHIVNTISSVYVNKTLLSDTSYTYAPGDNWISTSSTLTPGSIVTINYTVPPELDMILGNWNPNFGLYLYFSFVNVSDNR